MKGHELNHLASIERQSFEGIYGRDIYKHRAATFGKQIKKTTGEKPQELDYLSSKLFKSLLNLFTHLFFVVSVEVS